MSLDGKDITHAKIVKMVNGIGKVMCPEITGNEIDVIVKNIESKHQITMSLGFTLVDQSHKPWLTDNKENIKWYYWNRYKQLLIKNGFGNTVVGKMDIVTDEILDLLQDPKDEGAWQRKGLVVGHVQSGKTANYAAVVCKALDAGYRIVIIMAGLLNSLRKQTQGRVDSGVIGLDSSLMLHDIAVAGKLVGVGHFSHEEKNCPVSITTADADFNKSTATQQQAAIAQFKPPLIFVVKKNVSILKNLIDWLKNNNTNLNDSPMLLIDDESDHASINTKKDDLDPTRTNERIRELLKLFPKNVYLGYTATPFANIFINPDTPEEMMNDLFPENFIKTLDAPSNYFGGMELFVNNKFNAIREIVDYADFLPLKHKKEQLPGFIPESLKESIRVFILVCAIRILRDDGSKHNSMLVNISRFTGIQSQIRILIHTYLSDLKNVVSNYCALPVEEAQKNNLVKSIAETYNKEFLAVEFDWREIQAILNKAIARIEVIEVNSSSNAEKNIDYSERNYPNGRHLITIGGLSLSRGITLEGLSISYFLRNSIMYDTLMQMGRWFGYRPNYEDLCRIYMTEQAKGWYEYIANATEELRDEFRKMDDLKKTPKDFGLCVRNHPDSLIVTARNKMRSAKTVVREIDLTGRLIETSRLFTDSEKVIFNLEQAEKLLVQLEKENLKKELRNTNHKFFANVPADFIGDFIEVFHNHPESSLTDSKSVKEYVQVLAEEEGIDKWNVLFVNIQPKDKDVDVNILQDNLKLINPGIRRTVSYCTAGIMLSQRKLGSGNIDRVDLKENEIRETPLLMVHILDCRTTKNKKISNPIFPNGVVAYGISFPGEKNGKKITKLTTYQVNTIWMNEQYGSTVETDEDIEGEL
ncbi:MAG: endonuclease [Melioribacteraceae bacterium]|nr:MAG: endonuclease [Melioribacteraceae bacterium]